ncbi:MAG: cobalamin-binding protein [Rugosibacter sp.]|nr:cobalamin-binding protein [Rugosibacter sp.]
MKSYSKTRFLLLLWLIGHSPAWGQTFKKHAAVNQSLAAVTTPATPSTPAKRIISLAPHMTELLYAAGAGNKLVGNVDYGDYPPAAKALPKVGGYTRPDLEAILALKPDLVIAWESGNPPAALEKLKAMGIFVHVSQPDRIEDVAREIERLGVLAGTESVANPAAAAFRERHAALAARYSQRPVVDVFYQIWKQPLMTVNDKQIISDAIRLCGGRNVFGSLPVLAPTVTVEAVIAANPEVIVASGMGDERPEWLNDWRRWKTMMVVKRDNLYFIPPQEIQRHTPRLLDGAEKLCQALESAREKRPANPHQANHQINPARKK